MPKASVVIPCFNAEAHLAETIRSACSQTLRDIEIICIDNNSTDGTPQILRKLAAKDKRISIVSETEPGEGPARDAGRKLATGEWLYFLDSDDIMKPNLLSKAVEQGEQDNADVVVFKTTYLDDKTGECRSCPECFDAEWIDNWLDAKHRIFSPADNPSKLFNSFQNWVHNKLFRASFVKKQHLQFQHIQRMADILFTCRALSEAHQISLLDESLHLYRCNNANSALYTTDNSPLDFYQAFLELRRTLESNGTWEIYRNSYINWAEEAVAMNIYRARSYEAFSAIISEMKTGGLEKLGIAGFPDEQAFTPIRHECCKIIAAKELPEIAFHYFALERRHMTDLETELSTLRQSTTFRMGEKIVSPLSHLKETLIAHSNR